MSKKFSKIISEDLAPGKIDIRPKVLFKYRSLHPVKNAIKKGLVFASIAGMSLVGIEAQRELIEEINTDNPIVNIGPFLFKNKETRSAEVLYQNIEDAILNMEGIEKTFKGSQLTKEEKSELLQKIAETISKEANIKTDDYLPLDIFPEGVNGAYVHFNFNIASVGIGHVMMKNINIEQGAFEDAVQTLIHEMLHAVTYENNMLSDQLTDFDKKLLSIPQLVNSQSYYSSFVETNVHLLTSKIMLKLVDKYYPDIPFHTFDSTRDVFKEIIKNLYGVEIERPDVLSNLFKEDNNINQMRAFKNFEADIKNYQTKTLKELFIAGYEQKLKDQNIKYDNIDLKNTFYYRLGMHIIDGIKNVRYCDYANQNYNIKIENVLENVENFEAQVDRLKEYKIAVQLGEYDSAIRYNSNDYTQEELNIMNATIENYLSKLSEKNIIRFGFKEKVAELNAKNAQMNNISDASIIEEGLER
jgi:hypothetical protein